MRLSIRRTTALRLASAAVFALVLASPAFAQSPWEESADKLQAAFTGPIARGLALVAIVVGGLTVAFGEGQGKKAIGGLVFGVGMAVGAVTFMSWLFGR